MDRKTKPDFFEIKGFKTTLFSLSLLFFLFLLGLILLILYCTFGDFIGKSVLAGFAIILTGIGGLLLFVLLFLTLRKLLWIQKHVVYISKDIQIADCHVDEENASFSEKKGVKTTLFYWDGPINGGEDFFVAPVEEEGEIRNVRLVYFAPFPVLPFPILSEGETPVRAIVFDDGRTYLLALAKKGK